MAGSFEVGSVVAKVTADLSQFKQGMQTAKDEAAGLGEHIGNVAESIRGIAEKAAIFVELQTVAFEELGRRAIEVAANFEQTETSFGTMLGSEQKAAELMKEIMSFEQHTPFDIQTLTNAAKEMLAFGVNAKQVVPIMSQLTDLSQGQTSRLTELVSIYGEVNSIQQLNGREVFRLSSIGIPIYQAIEDHFKKIGDASMDSGEKVKKAIEKGQITAAVFNDVLTEMTSKGGLFYQENIRQMSTFNGIISSTKSQIEYAILGIMGIDLNAKNQIIKGGLFDTLRGLAASLLDWLHKLQPVFQQIGTNKDFQYAIEGIVVALASLAIILPVVVLALNPLVLGILAVEAVIVGLFVIWNTNFLGIRDITKSVFGEVVNFFQNYLMPVIREFTPFFRVEVTGWGAIIQYVFGLIVSYIKFYWDLAYGILKVGIDLLTGNWKKAWDDIKSLLNNAWQDIMGILNAGLGNIGKWGGQVISALVKPFEDAFNSISDIVNKIKDKLDFTKRHSPSVLDVVQNGVQLVNNALMGINFTPDISTSQIANNILSPVNSVNYQGMGSGINLTINLPNAIVSDSATANAVAEKIGNQIINRLKQNVRF